jgi:hypothetical protein
VFSKSARRDTNAVPVQRTWSAHRGQMSVDAPRVLQKGFRVYKRCEFVLAKER